MEKPIKFIKPKLKTKRYHKLHGPTMSIEEYEKITRPKNLKFKPGLTSGKTSLNETLDWISLYSGKVKNKKANGWGIEITIHSDTTIHEYYEGEWKNGKRDGYGECYDYHPLIGEPIIFDHPYDSGEAKMYFLEEDGKVYKGYWKNGKKVSK